MATKKPAMVAPRQTARSLAIAADKAWAARDDLRTIQSAAAIQSDPKRVKAAQAEAQNQIAALVKVTGKK